MNSEEIYKKLHKLFHPSGMTCGEEIAKKLKKKGNFTFSLYRSALVLTPLKNGGILLEFYHDPHWMGHDKITKKNLQNFKDCKKILLHGQRSGVDVYYSYLDKAIKISDLFQEEFIEIANKHSKIIKKLVERR